MAAVSSYWCLPEEEAELLDYLGAWSIFAYPPNTFRKASDVKPVPLQELLGQNPSQISFAPQHFLSEKDIGQREFIGGVPYYGVSPMQSHTIAYRRPSFHEDGSLGKSNLSAYWKYPDAEAIGFVEKNAEFIKWAKKVLNWSRKRASEKLFLHGYAYPATPKVKELVERKVLVVGY